MSPETFQNRLESGKSNSHLYRVEAREGLVNVWKHQDRWILTWEECPRGEQYDESSYTRDEIHRFETLAELLRFLGESGLSATDFRP